MSRIYLDGQEFDVRNYSRSTTDDLVARFGSSEKGQTNLDLLKAKTQKSFAGGMFQAQSDDDQKVASIKGMYFNENDQKLYMATDFIEKTTSATFGENVTAWCFANGKLFFAVHNTYWGAGSEADQNKLFYYDPGTDTYGAVGLPTAQMNTACPITDMVYHADKIFLCGKQKGIGGFKILRVNVSTFGTFELATDIYTFRKLCSFRGKLYAMGLRSLHLVTDELGAGKFTQIKEVGIDDPDIDNVNRLFEFNGAMWIAKTDGLFRYDGVDVVKVLDDSRNQVRNNFGISEVFNGAIYYTRGSALWRFDGTNVEKVQDLASMGEVLSLCARDDRLWILTRQPTTYRLDDPSWKIGAPPATTAFRLIAYNGVGFFMYKVFSASAGYIYTTPIVAVGYGQTYVVMPFASLKQDLSPQHMLLRTYRFKHSYEFTSDRQQLEGEVIGSSDAFGYPAVDKVLNGIGFTADDLLTRGTVTADLDKSRMRVYIRAKTTSDSIWNDWSKVYDTKYAMLTNQQVVGTDYYLFDQYYDQGELEGETLYSEPIVAREFEYKLVITVQQDAGFKLYQGFVPRLSNFTLRYTLQPKVRRKWQLTLAIDGDDSDNYNDGIAVNKSATQLRQKIYNALAQKKPVIFLDIDYSKIVSREFYDTGFYDQDNTDSIVHVAGDAFYHQTDALAFRLADGTWGVRNIVFYTPDGNDDQAVYLSKDYGQRHGIGGGTFSYVSELPVGAEVRRAHAVQITQIPMERVIIDENTENADDKQSHVQSEITLYLTEI